MTTGGSVYSTPDVRLTGLSKVRGLEMSFAMPPKWASIWSAMITETAIVMSAWRRSWPWFQRRKACWISTPTPPTMRPAAISGKEPVHEADLGAGDPERRVPARDGIALQLQSDIATEQEERAVGHVHHAHEPEDEGEAAGDDEVQRRRGDAVEERDEEVLGVVDGRAEGRVRRDEQDPDDRERDDQGEQHQTRDPQRPPQGHTRGSRAGRN